MLTMINKNYGSEVLTSALPWSGDYIDCGFSKCSMPKAVLTGNFQNCYFINTDLSGAVISGALFVKCNFSHTNFTEATFRKCKFVGCRFGGANFKGAKGLSTCKFQEDCTYLFESKNSFVYRDPHSKTFIVEPLDEEPIEGKVVGDYEPRPAIELDREPEKLPELPNVEHYRSVQSEAAEIDEDYYADVHFSSWERAYYSYYEPAVNFGYGGNAVLECPDIDEYKGCD